MESWSFEPLFSGLLGASSLSSGANDGTFCQNWEDFEDKDMTHVAKCSSALFISLHIEEIDTLR